MGNFDNELKNYECIPRELVYDSSLSDRARFLYIYMACKPEGWEFFLEPMSVELGYGKETLRKYLNELISAGWLTRGPQASNTQGQFGATRYILKSERGNTDTGERPQERRDLKGTETERADAPHEAESHLSPQGTINWEHFLSFFNTSMENKAIKPVSRITDKRKQSVSARLREYGKDSIMTVIKKAAASDFLNGKNNRNWVADFDWLFKPNNFPKVLEGNYDNREINKNQYGRETVTDKMRRTIAEAEEFDRMLTAMRETGMGDGDNKPVW